MILEGAFDTHLEAQSAIGVPAVCCNTCGEDGMEECLDCEVIRKEIAKGEQNTGKHRVVFGRHLDLYVRMATDGTWGATYFFTADPIYWTFEGMDTKEDAISELDRLVDERIDLVKELQ